MSFGKRVVSQVPAGGTVGLAVPELINHVDAAIVLYAVLSLTVVRMLPVAIALIGSGTSRAEVAFIGWFGPRGLASVIFALLALEDLKGHARDIVATVGLTVMLSVVAHGLSAGPLARRLGSRESPAVTSA